MRFRNEHINRFAASHRSILMTVALTKLLLVISW